MDPLIAYCFKTKQKSPFQGKPNITKSKNGRYLAQGVDAAGNKMAAALSEAKALEAIQGGVATQGW